MADWSQFTAPIKYKQKLKNQSLKFHKLPATFKQIKLFKNYRSVLNKQLNQKLLKKDDVKILRCARTKRSTIPTDYEVYLQEPDYNTGAENDPE